MVFVDFFCCWFMFMDSNLMWVLFCCYELVAHPALMESVGLVTGMGTVEVLVVLVVILVIRVELPLITGLLLG